MKKMLKAGVLITVVGIVLLILSIMGGGVQSVEYVGWTPRIVKKEMTLKKQTVSEFENVKVNTDNVGVKIIQGNGYHVDYKGRKSLAPKISVEGKTLVIKQKAHLRTGFIFDGVTIKSDRHTSFTNTVTVMVPKDLDQISLTTSGNSDVTLSDLKLNSLALDVLDGDLHLTNTQVANSSKVKLLDGDLYLNRVAFNNGTKMEIFDGDLSLVDTSLNNVQIENHDGDVSFNRLKVAGGSYKGQDSDVNGASLEVTAGYQFNLADGDVSITGAKADGYETTTTDGDNHLFNQSGSHLTQGANSGNVLKVTTTDGDLNIR